MELTPGGWATVIWGLVLILLIIALWMNDAWEMAVLLTIAGLVLVGVALVMT